jgi:hypothetical protein
MPQKLQAPPSSVTGPLGAWLSVLWQYIEKQPSISLASFAPTATPNSSVTGQSGDLCVNLGSGSTTSRLWVLGGNVRSTITDQGWALVRVLQL